MKILVTGGAGYIGSVAVEELIKGGSSAMLVGGSEKIRKALGWRPRHPDLQEMIASAWRWHQAHPHGYDDA